MSKGKRGKLGPSDEEKVEDVADDETGDSWSIAPFLYQLGKGGVTEDAGIMDTALPASEDVYGVAPMVHDALQDDREVALMIDECSSALVLAEDGDVCAIHGSHAFGGAHKAETTGGMAPGLTLKGSQSHFTGSL
ncbi:hypothetical protein Y1Q_0021552 [Alligator mississippiensis]|uniref:Uncharacterized protein n=1 Tax=Alligator mississippiensis TaxID=8496 RepID=A0A151PA82_ALLMI|nr:hypothetical protein Y1Q_0021552 [Alligator mississippiensis]